MTAPKLWAGRFAQDTDSRVHAFNSSLSFDIRLWPHDIEGSIAHVNMLGDCGIIPADDAASIAQGLIDLAADLKSGEAVLDSSAEDVHMAVEQLLTKRLGPVAGKLHTARSRNDQVATDLRLFARSEGEALQRRVHAVQEALLTQAENSGDAVLPGMTHLQHAQPIRLAHHLLAYFWMLTRDRERIGDALRRANVMPLGAGALAGTTFPIDRHMVSLRLGFDAPAQNSLDAVSDRDFAIELVSAMSILMMHLSRLCEELILWNTQAFGFVIMGDNVTTGSSIMPQKKNPDVAELIRGKTGRVYGDLIGLLSLMKSLPLAYNKDMQEDKEPLFDAFDTCGACLDVLATLLLNCRFDTKRMAAALKGDFSTATDLADYLVRQGLPFREAHAVVGKLVADCLRAGIGLEDLTVDRLCEASPLFAGADAAALTGPLGSAAARESYGGTGREAVAGQLRQASEWIRSHQP